MSPVRFRAVLEEETRRIREGRSESGLPADSGGPSGLSLSGGGVRAACFSLGLLEGLDRSASPRPEPTTVNSLEEFDYVSGVSGGSYALGHLVTASLPDAPRVKLGDIQFTSQTVPGWLWGVGVFFLGVSFQLIKTGTLLLAFLATVALVLRSLDAPEAMRFCSALGLDSDVSRGFVPFWLTLWIFLTGYGIESVKLGGRVSWSRLWFWYASGVIASYLVDVWWLGGSYPALVGDFSFDLQFLHLAALVVPVLPICVAVAVLDRLSARSCIALILAALTTVALVSALKPGGVAFDWSFEKFPRAALREMFGVGLPGLAAFAVVMGLGAWRSCSCRRSTHPGMRLMLTIPLLMALFCLAGLVTTGDVSPFSISDDPEQVRRVALEGQRYGRLGDQVAWYLWAMLGATAIGLLFPFRILKSARALQDDVGPARAGGKILKWMRDPVYHVVVFLCSYGFILLVVFVTYSTVAAEDVSLYFTWRDNLKSSVIHPGDFLNWEQAWRKIDRDADPKRKDDSEGWHDLARELMKAREAAGRPIEQERRERVEMRILEAMPWGRRVLGSLMFIPMPRSWQHDAAGIPGASASSARLFELRRRDHQRQADILARVAERLQDPGLLGKVPKRQEKADIRRFVASMLDRESEPDRKDREEAERWAPLEDEYRLRAEALASDAEMRRYRDGESDPAYLASVGNNNRLALRLYLRDLMYDRRERVVFAGIVWPEDQWSRLWIAGTSLLIWALCCAIDPNTFSLQRFYRRHVIDGWINLKPKRMRYGPWLDRAGKRYRGRGGESRRAPIPLFHATLEGNRSLGHEPDMPNHIFTFSPLASGVGTTPRDRRWWRAAADEEAKDQDGGPGKDDEKGKERFARSNDLDLGNIVATSGAFLSPGTIANPALSVLLHLLNIQTGYWAQKPAKRGDLGLAESLAFHACQSLGIDVEDDSRFMLTDGAHVENLGLYALIVRRCKLIVAVDCSQEDRGASRELRFRPLVQVLQQAESDGVHVGPFLNGYAFRRWRDGRGRLPERGGVDDCHRLRAVGLDLLLPADRDGSAPCDPISQEHYVFAELHYPEGSKGLLVYVRPTLTGDEGDGLLLVGRSSVFPDDDPVDQFYTPARMSQYRLLGAHIARTLVNDPIFREAFRPEAAGRDRSAAATASPHPRRDGSCDWCSVDDGRHCQWRIPVAFRNGRVRSTRGAT